ncbi:MAG: single-stranded DNA-binding protein [Chloroflexi bacterium]|nr:single-stranded DNA-binding protein [Chloroflexota bacterium]
MARGLNKVMLIGNLGKDPEMKYTQQGTPVTTFSMAVSRSWKSPDGQAKEETEWFRIVAWQKLAEQCNEYLHKGSKVYIEGRLQTREWQAPDGQQKQIVEVIANEMLLIDSRQGGTGPMGVGSTEDRPAKSSGGGGGYNNSNTYDESDIDVDDIPF